MVRECYDDYMEKPEEINIRPFCSCGLNIYAQRLFAAGDLGWTDWTEFGPLMSSPDSASETKASSLKKVSL